MRDKVFQSLNQLVLSFFDRIPPKSQAARSSAPSTRCPSEDRVSEKESYPSPFQSEGEKESGSLSDRAHEMRRECRTWLLQLGLPALAQKINVVWNPRMRSTAGRARYRDSLIELNPLIEQFPGERDRTLRHELAHLIAYARARGKRIEAHGLEWQQACSDLGIPGETATHHLPLPRRKIHKAYSYRCPSCAKQIDRVRPFRRASACADCCKKYNRGVYDERFRLKLISKPSANKSPKTISPIHLG